MNQDYIDLCIHGDDNPQMCNILRQGINCTTRAGLNGFCTYIDPGQVGIGICRCLNIPNPRPRTTFNQNTNPWTNTYILKTACTSSVFKKNTSA